MITIDRQLRKYFIMVIIASVLVIFALSNLGMAYFFNNYVKQTNLKSDLKIAEYIQDVYQRERGLAMISLPGLMQIVRGEEAEIRLLDTSGRLLLNTLNLGQMGMGRGQGMMNRRDISEEDLVFQGYLLKVEGVIIGKVEIGRTKAIIASAQDRDFFLTMNLVFLIALLLSILLALYISKFVTKKFLQPLLAVKGNIESIARKSPNDPVPVLSSTKEIQELARATEELARSLRDQEKLRKRLTADVAHELRTPLATLQSHLEAMIDGIWEPTAQRLSHCNDELIRLIRLINDLNQLTGIESDDIKLNIIDVNLSQLLERLMENYKLILEEKNIEVQGAILPDITIRGDSDRLKQIFGNVVTNACKYTADNGTVKISLAGQVDKAIVEIQDNGIGIKTEDLPHIFERFYRGDLSRSRKSGGTGIGLTIAKALTEAHQGTMLVDSELGRGTTVTIILPLKSAT